MWQRIKTAIVLVIIVGVAMFASSSPMLFLPLLMVGATIASYEWTKLTPKTNPAWFMVLVFVITLASVLMSWSHLWWWVLSCGIWLLATRWVMVYPTQEMWYGKRLFVMGVIILTASMTAMYSLWQVSPWWLMYVFLLVWCADSGAYFVGRKLGKHKLAPHVSPNKSIEGLMGGVMTASLVAIGVGFGLKLDTVAFIAFLGLSGLTVLASVLGDLFESMLKRRADIKDSGTILPGHGGVLDRIDSLLSATPVFAFGVWVLAYFGVLPTLGELKGIL
ncbi:MAG: phosphatidate cytidylyltransferase [Moraxella sp.]|nr:phosphatidate cytidylyltransferase [Moraxella sp.]